MTSLGAQVSVLRGVRVVGPGSELLADDEPVDLHLQDGFISDIAPVGAVRPQGEVLDLDGSFVVPGLWDHHVHTVQWALAAEREPLHEADSAVEAAAVMSTAAPLPDGRRIGTGFRDALWADAPSLRLLDEATGEVPTYLINSDVHSVWLNSAALAREGLQADDGVLREHEAFEVSRRLNAVDELHADRVVRDAGRRAAARGVVGLVDFDMTWNASAWARRTGAGFDAHRVEFAIYPDDLDRAVREGLRTGGRLDAVGLVHVGPLKVIGDGSLGTRTAACSHDYVGEPGNRGALNVDPAELVSLLTRAAGAGIACAVHGIGDHAVGVALDAFALSGATGTIEHAQLVRHADLVRFARLGIAASVQPQHALDDAEMASSLWAEQTALPYPMSSLLAVGAQLRLGSDAPVAPLDPWVAIAAATFRGSDAARAPWLRERLTFDQALKASTRSAVRPGQVADLAVCATDPRAADAAALRGMQMEITLLGGRVTHLR